MSNNSSNNNSKGRKYIEWKCDKCNLILKAKNSIKLARLVRVHMEFHDSTSSPPATATDTYVVDTPDTESE